MRRPLIIAGFAGFLPLVGPGAWGSSPAQPAAPCDGVPVVRACVWQAVIGHAAQDDAQKTDELVELARLYRHQRSRRDCLCAEDRRLLDLCGQVVERMLRVTATTWHRRLGCDLRGLRGRRAERLYRAYLRTFGGR